MNDDIIRLGERNLLDSLDMVATGRFSIHPEENRNYYLATGGRKFCPILVSCGQTHNPGPIGRTQGQAILTLLDGIREKAKNSQVEQNINYQALSYLIDNLFAKHYKINNIDLRVSGHVTTYAINMVLAVEDSLMASSLYIEFVNTGGDFLKIVPSAVAREMSYYTAFYEPDGRVSQYKGYAITNGEPVLIVDAELFGTSEDFPANLAAESSLACYAFGMRNLYRVEFSAGESTTTSYYYMRDHERQPFRGDVTFHNTKIDEAYATRTAKEVPNAV